MKRKTWQSPNSTSIRALYTEQALLLEAHEQENAAIIDMAWVSNLVPAGQLVLIKKGQGLAKGFFCLRSEQYAFLGWPVKKIADCVDFVIDEDLRRLPWVVVTDPKQVWVVPTRATRPLRAMVAQRTTKSLKIGCMWAIDGEKIPLLKWQCQRGFANVSEECLKKLKAHLGAEDIVQPGASVESEDALVTDLVVHLEPSISEDALLQRLQQKTIEEVGVGEEPVGNMGQDVLDDCLLTADRKAVMDDMKELKQEEKTRALRRLRALSAVKQASSSLKKPRSQPKLSKAFLAVQAQRKAKGERWWASIHHDTKSVDMSSPSALWPMRSRARAVSYFIIWTLPVLAGPSVGRKGAST
mmetsp:Transcript_68395/g.198263  ORF Transcript_68395/g.198263 Transcript_68395/m.198263 type:complete len:355 (+) Transcript_68395:67-1131(+)